MTSYECRSALLTEFCVIRNPLAREQPCCRRAMTAAKCRFYDLWRQCVLNCFFLSSAPRLRSGRAHCILHTSDSLPYPINFYYSLLFTPTLPHRRRHLPSTGDCSMRLSIRLVAFLVSLPIVTFAQTSPTVGLRDNTPTVHAFTGARIVPAPGKVIPNGTLVIRKGVIEAVGEKVAIPADARVWDLKGLTVYPGLIELSSTYGMMAAPTTTPGGPPASAQPQHSPSPPLSWNAKTFSHLRADEEFRPDAKTAEKLRSQGFVLALTRTTQGIFRGSSALVNLGDGAARDLVVRGNVAQHIALVATGSFLGGYPNSLMGTIAHVRQTFIDADWYRRAQEAYSKNPSGLKRPETNASLTALVDAS